MTNYDDGTKKAEDSINDNKKPLPKGVKKKEETARRKTERRLLQRQGSAKNMKLPKTKARMRRLLPRLQRNKRPTTLQQPFGKIASF